MAGDASSSMCSNVCKELLLESLLEDESDDEGSQYHGKIKMLQPLQGDDEIRDRVLSKARSIHPADSFAVDDDEDEQYHTTPRKSSITKASPFLQQPFAFGRRQRQLRQARQKAAEVHSTSGLELWRACTTGDVRYVQQTLRLFPHLIHLEQQGRTPLFLACQAGHVPIVEVLLQAGAMDLDGTVYASSEHPECRALLQQYKIIDDTLNGTIVEQETGESFSDAQQDDVSCSTPRMQNLSCFTPKQDDQRLLGAVGIPSIESPIMRTVSMGDTNHVSNVSRNALEDIPLVVAKQATENGPHDGAVRIVNDVDERDEAEEPEDQDHASQGDEPYNVAASNNDDDEDEGEDDDTVYETIEYGEREFLTTKKRGHSIVAQASTIIRHRTRSGVNFLKRSIQQQRATRSVATAPVMTAVDDEDSVVVTLSNIVGIAADGGDVDDDNMTVVSEADIGDRRHLDTKVPTTFDERLAVKQGPVPSRSLSSEQASRQDAADEEDDALGDSFSPIDPSGSMTSESHVASEAEEEDEAEENNTTHEDSASSALSKVDAAEDLEVEIDDFERIAASLTSEDKTEPNSPPRISRPFFPKRFAMFTGKTKEYPSASVTVPSLGEGSASTFSSTTTQLYISVSVEDKDGDETDDMSYSMEEDDDTESSSASSCSSSLEKYTMYSDAYPEEAAGKDFCCTLSAGIFGPPDLVRQQQLRRY